MPFFTQPDKEFTMGSRVYTYDQIGSTVTVRYNKKPIGSVQSDGTSLWNASVLPINGSDTQKYPGLPTIQEGLIAITRTYNAYLWELENLNSMWDAPVDPRYNFR